MFLLITVAIAKQDNPIISAQSPGELSDVYAIKLISCNTKSALLSLTPPYFQSFVSQSRNIKTITNLFDKKYMDMDYNMLLDVCTGVKIELTDNEIRITCKE